MRPQLSMALAVLIACAGFAHAGEKKPAAEFSFHHDHVLGTSLDVWLVAPSAADAEKAEQAILEEIERLRLVFSTFDPKSEISLLNRSAGPTPASMEMIEVLREYEVAQRRSSGAFHAGSDASSALEGEHDWAREGDAASASAVTSNTTVRGAHDRLPVTGRSELGASSRRCCPVKYRDVSLALDACTERQSDDIENSVNRLTRKRRGQVKTRQR